jgi:toxin ParE1/3/4
MPAKPVKFRLATAARAALFTIYDETAAKYGRYQAEAYYAGLMRTFGLLADFPGMGVSADELKAGHRRFRFQSHFIYYTGEKDYVAIRTIMHVRQKLRPGLIE